MRDEEAREAAERALADLGYRALRLARMETGLCHRVFEAELAGGGSLVLRLGTPETRERLRGGVYWHARLSSLGVPLPALLHASLEGPAPYMVIERLAGRDLLFEHASMSQAQLRALARELADVQLRVARLPLARGYGFAVSYDDPGLLASSDAVVGATLERARRRLRGSGACDPGAVDGVKRRVAALAPHLARVEPVAFLDDITTKNVLIHEGRLSGIVDTDQVCFGDRLYTVGLIKMALLSEGFDTSYADYWVETLRLDRAAAAAVELYAAVFCLDFLGELGQRFNRDAPIPVSREQVGRLVATLRAQLAAADELARGL